MKRFQKRIKVTIGFLVAVVALNIWDGSEWSLRFGNERIVQRMHRLRGVLSIENAEKPDTVVNTKEKIAE